MPQPHTHEAHGSVSETKRYIAIFLITLGILLVQIVGGTYARSVAIFADSAHVALDGVSALISIYVSLTVRRHTDQDRFRITWMRVSCGLLLLSLAWIGFEAIRRLQDPEMVRGWSVLVIASIGALGNIWQHRLLPQKHTDATSHAQKLHIEGDLYSSIAIIFGGLLMGITGWSLVDPLLALAIVLFVGYRTIVLLLNPQTGHTH